MTTVTQSISSLGTVPTTSDPVNFDPNADIFLGSTLPTLRTEMNTFGGQVNAVAGEVNANAVQVAADKVTVAADKVTVAADRVLSEAAAVQTAADKAESAANAIVAAEQADIALGAVALVLPARINSIGIPGAAGFGKGICPPANLPAGFTPLPGYTEPLHDNFGDYQYSEGSILGYVPKFWYRVGHIDNPTYVVYGVNSVDIKGLETFTSTAEANAAGYALHRAFIDGGVEKVGFFVDKFQCSNNGGIASSIAHGLPLSSAATHNPFSGLTGAPPNFFHGALVAAKTRGPDFFCCSRFIHSGLALLALAHGQAATSTTNCAWYSVTTTNFPKGNNNNALGDTNDTSVLYVSDGYPNCGKTGSGLPFAKTTHNGQGCGVADLNGNILEVSLGLTCTAVAKSITGVALTNPCGLTIVGHGAASGALLQVTGIVGTTQLNEKINTLTAVDADHVSLDGVDATAFTPYTSGGTAAYGTFSLLKSSAIMKNLTSGNTLATDHWGASGIGANFDTIVPNFNTLYPSNSSLQKYGNAANQVLASAISGPAWAMTGAGMPLAAGTSPAGTNNFGLDYYYQRIITELCPLAGGLWTTGTSAGVWGLDLAYVRGNSNANGGFRAALYP